MSSAFGLSALLKRIAADLPSSSLHFFVKSGRKKGLKRLCQSGIRDVALILVEFTRCEQAARRN